MQRKDAMMERERKLKEQINPKAESKQEEEEKKDEESYLGLDINTMGGNIPGFKYVKDRVIKPLIVATEKVVEYYFNEE